MGGSVDCDAACWISRNPRARRPDETRAGYSSQAHLSLVTGASFQAHVPQVPLRLSAKVGPHPPHRGGLSC